MAGATNMFFIIVFHYTQFAAFTGFTEGSDSCGNGWRAMAGWRAVAGTTNMLLIIVFHYTL
jgi:hypothetical protein